MPLRAPGYVHFLKIFQCNKVLNGIFPDLPWRSQVCLVALFCVESVGMLGKVTALSRLDEWGKVAGRDQAAARIHRLRKQE